MNARGHHKCGLVGSGRDSLARQRKYTTMLPKRFRKRVLYGVLVILMYPWTLLAASLQYNLSTSFVITASNETIAAATGYDIITIAEPVSAIVWPVPSGCSVGQADWTRITDAGGVSAAGAGMAVRTDLFWFTSSSTLLTGCHQVESWADLKKIVEAAIAGGIDGFDFFRPLAHFKGATEKKCPSGNNSPACVAARASQATLEASFPSEAELDALLAQAATLRTESIAFKSARGW